jgi:hypothetical protein
MDLKKRNSTNRPPGSVDRKQIPRRRDIVDEDEEKEEEEKNEEDEIKHEPIAEK